MKKKINLKIWAIILLIGGCFSSAAAQTWDAATCADLCQILLEQGYYIDSELIHQRGYTLQNNVTSDDGSGFMACYSKNVVMTRDGNNIVSLGKGVSSLVMAQHAGGSLLGIAISFFNDKNAATFRNQMTNIGFQKVKTSRGITYYYYNGITIEEQNVKQGKYVLRSFMLHQ